MSGNRNILFPSSVQRFHVSIPPAAVAKDEINVPIALSAFRDNGCSEAYSLTFKTDGYGIFNVRINLSACRTHEGGGGSGTNQSPQELTRRDRKPALHPAPPGDRTQGLGIRNPTL